MEYSQFKTMRGEFDSLREQLFNCIRDGHLESARSVEQDLRKSWDSISACIDKDYHPELSFLTDCGRQFATVLMALSRVEVTPRDAALRFDAFAVLRLVRDIRLYSFGESDKLQTAVFMSSVSIEMLDAHWYQEAASWAQEAVNLFKEAGGESEYMEDRIAASATLLNALIAGELWDKAKSALPAALAIVKQVEENAADPDYASELTFELRRAEVLISEH